MLDYRATSNAMHVRTTDVSWQEYLFVLQVVMGEDICVAYASVFDNAEFKRNVPSEDENEYLSKFKMEAEQLIGQQNCIHLKEYLEDEWQSAVQAATSTLKDYKFTGADIQKLLANLLASRTESLDEASVKDVISLIKSMFDSGYLDSDEAWQRHFITIPAKYNALCTSCNRELSAVAGLDIKCRFCGQVYKWNEQERRFFPSFGKI